MDLVLQTVLDLWHNGRKVKKSPAGWLYGNAVCCHHRGESLDKRSRGGLMINADSVAYNCFNCGFKIVYKQGDGISSKFRKFLSWLSADEKMIQFLVLDALRSSTEESDILPKAKSIIEECDLPSGAQLIEENTGKFPEHVNYIYSRGLDLSSYPFMATTIDGDSRYTKRIILPFVRHGKFVGYTARGISPVVKPKYIMRMTCPYVFGLDLQQFDWQWAILSEGPFDALSVDGLGVMHNVCNDDQAQLINNLNKKIIVVPHLDRAGIKQKESLLHDAIDNDWWVSIPNWGNGVKDLNQAVCKYGVLASTQIILQNATNNPAKILLEAKFFK